MDGIGFGLGVAVVIDPAKSQLLRSAGEFCAAAYDSSNWTKQLSHH